nr:MAG TPA: Membrane MotB of proton-channel complex MotA/MotB [Caudoviricetes sp.]
MLLLNCNPSTSKIMFRLLIFFFLLYIFSYI